MAKGIKYLVYIFGVLIGTLLIIAGYLTFYLPKAEAAPEISIDIDEVRVERGKYLANHVMLCMDCHAVRDFSLFAGPPTPGTLGGGGDVFDQNMGFPGRFVSRNLTPFALSDWTDGEIFRAITTGVSKDGSALFPVMPYPHYSQLDPEDIYSVIAYLRTLEPVENELESSKADFPVSLLINTMPVQPNFQSRPSIEDPVEYGKYMITAAACTDCHTRMEKGAFVGEPYAGGNEFRLPDGSIVRAANLTPHETGIKYMSKEQFVQRFKVYADTSYVPRKVQPGEFQTLMPWQMYAGMKTEDLEAIYDYLQTLEPVENRVEIFTAAGDN